MNLDKLKHFCAILPSDVIPSELTTNFVLL
jgi:hypothetical protein